jgi:predicted small secreted protein
MRGGFVMRRTHSWLIPPAFVVVIGSALLAGCGDTNPEGSPPAGGTVGAIKEKAGKLATSAVDKSGKVVEETGKAVEKAGQNLQTTAQETVKEKLGEKTGQVVEGTGKAVEKAGQSIESAGQKIQDSVKKP